MNGRIGGSVLLVTVTLLMCGCQTITEAGYYWGNYDQTLYALTKSPSDETQAAHVETLKNIISKSAELNLKVPPGVYAELAYMESRAGNTSEAAKHYQNEVSLYPESRLFIERLTSETEETGEEK